MSFFDEPWFWSGGFAVAASLGGVLIAELFAYKRLVHIERLKIYDLDILSAHKSLYAFVSRMGNRLFPPDDHSARDFADLMKKDFYESVKPNMLLFAPETRRILRNFEAQYECMRNPDLKPDTPLDEFLKNDLFRSLEQLEKQTEKASDRALNALR
jgi:hypothetical protein